jgi:exosome complex exonuclease RRP6
VLLKTCNRTFAPFIYVYSYPHPYEYEISAFNFLPEQLTTTKEHKYPPLTETPLHWVDTYQALEQLKVKLEQEKEFAVDLEAHSYRSFQGFVCLMQISTRSEDFIIDTLSLRSKMHILNGPFTNPRIVKVENLYA